MIGIFGGTFDPVHYGHLRAALEAKEIFDLDEMRLIPSAQPPHRNAPEVPAAMRLAMLKLAVEGQPGFIADSREIERPGASYMAITLESLRREFPDRPLILFIGGDAFEKLTSWYAWQTLFGLGHLVVLTRPFCGASPLDAFFTEKLVSDPALLRESLAGYLYFQDITQLDISATKIRSMFVQGKSPRYLMPESVIDFIHEHRLYRS